MKEKFKEIRFKASSLAMINKAATVVDEFDEKGYKLTVRQLYYQLVKANEIPNSERSYQNLINLISDARLAGLIDWNAIEDRTRSLRGLIGHDGPGQVAREASYRFHLDRWENQDHRIEVWVEKEALADVVSQSCTPFDVDYFACRGYASQTAFYDAGKRLQRYASEGKEIHIIHLGDHDPSGIDMSRDIQDRLKLLSYDTEFTFHRIALNMDQINEMKPPPNPAKLTDSRCKEYIRRFGKSSWELDAIDPDKMKVLIQNKIKEYIDRDKWEETEEKEREGKEKLEEMAEKLEENE